MPCKFQNLYLGVRGWWWRSGAVVVDEVRIVRCMKKNDRRCVRRSTTRSREPFVLREVPTNLQTLSGLLDVEVRIWDSRWSRSRDAKKFPAVENKLSCCLVEVARRKKKRKEIKKELDLGNGTVVLPSKELFIPIWKLFAHVDFTLPNKIPRLKKAEHLVRYINQ